MRIMVVAPSYVPVQSGIDSKNRDTFTKTTDRSTNRGLSKDLL